MKLYCKVHSNRRIKVEYYNDNFETKESVTFLGDLGTESYSYCPYCGVKHTGFRPYDINPDKFSSVEDDEDEEEWDEYDSWWPDAPGVTLIDDEEEKEEDGNPWEMDDESLLVAFSCPDCGEKFRLNPKGCKKTYCYFCGKVARRNDSK